MKIYLKLYFDIIGKIHFASSESSFRFTVLADNKYPSTIEVIPMDNRIDTYQEIDCPEKEWNDFKEYRVGGIFQTNPSHTIKEAESCLIRDTRKVLYFIKYYLGFTELDEQLCTPKKLFVSDNGVSWIELPYYSVPTNVRVELIMNLDIDTGKVIQNNIDNKIEPFIALKYLHRAKNENIPSFKWIDATIAAELAIKEFLIRKKPDVETLLLEVPSPPLLKLYGVVLKSITGQSSPVLKEIDNGVQIRNKLVHRPSEVPIEATKALKYVQAVETAIFHLVYLLYPDDAIVRYYYQYLRQNIRNIRT